jgi:hypothetical protein
MRPLTVQMLASRKGGICCSAKCSHMVLGSVVNEPYYGYD